MKCPFCGQEMAEGRICCGDRPIDWIPDGETGSLFEFIKPEKGVRINPMFSSGAFAYRCEACRKIIVDY